jgi:hypothetical protein
VHDVATMSEAAAVARAFVHGRAAELDSIAGA